MIGYNLVYELKLLLRNRWIQILTPVLLFAFLFAGFNGQRKTDKRVADIRAARLEMAEGDKRMLGLLDSVERGLPVSVAAYNVPDQPIAVGNSYPRVVDMPPAPLAFTAVGQSDLYTHYLKPTFRGDDFALNYTELSSPVQLLFGSFDIAFVIIYLLPLIIIAFSYNLLSYEREHGSLRLLAAQPVSLYTWALQKLGLRFLILTSLISVILILTFCVSGLAVGEGFSELPGFLGLVLAYTLFWFALSLLVNLFGGSSATNAVGLLGLWVVFVLLLPASLNQVAAALYPVPARTLMVNEMRAIKADAAKRQDEILDSYLRDHPEYAAQEVREQGGFWVRYMASQQLVKDELAPLLASYDGALDRQQRLTASLQPISPAIIVQQALYGMAGTSTVDYDNFRRQVTGFAEEWRNYFLPLLYNNENFTAARYEELPQYVYRPAELQSLGVPIMILLAFSAGVLLLGWVSFRRKVGTGELILR